MIKSENKYTSTSQQSTQLTRVILMTTDNHNNQNVSQQELSKVTFYIVANLRNKFFLTIEST